MSGRMEHPELQTISNDLLEAAFEPSSGRLKVTDKRCGKTWEQAPLAEGLKVEGVSREGRTLRIELGGLPAAVATVELGEGPELMVALSAEAAAAWDRVQFPPAFQMPDKDHYLLQTDGEGLLLPADDPVYPLEEQPFFYCGGGPAMAWVGVADGDLNTGYMAIFETPFDAAASFRRENGLITFAPVWLSSMGAFGYDRKLRYVFFDQGGYVAQCKRYREFIWPKNRVGSLKDKRKRFPAIDKMAGAVHIYVWDKARETAFARELKDSGIDKALILWDANHLPYPEEGYDSRLKELGYGTGAYELFTDIHPDSYPGNAEIARIPLKRNVYPGLFEKITSRKKDGSTYSNQFGTYVCPQAVRPEMVKRVEKELALYPHETYFLDVYQANGIYECHHPEHPLTRQQYAEAILDNCKLLEERYNLYLGGEFGADYASAHGVYVHGMMTLQRTWFDSDANKQGTIHYMGNWKNNERPSIMVGARTAPDTYLQYSLNEYTRVPLYELVYHDAVVTSWRWEDCNHHCPEIWWKKDLFNILYGTAPLWSIDQERWASFRETFIGSYQKVCTWLQQICYDELVSHRFVSGDRKIQESRFSSGKRVIVNFGDAPYSHEGQVIAPRSFLVADGGVSAGK